MEGLFYYTTEEENKLTEAELPYLTENDTKLASYLKDYDPKAGAVVMVWHETVYYVNKLTNTSAVTSATFTFSEVDIHH